MVIFMNEELQDLLEYVDELTIDANLPRTVKEKFKEISVELKHVDGEAFSLKINKFLAELDDLCADSNLDAFTRQQIWSISSMLESLS